MKPIKPDELRDIDANSISERRISGLVAKINSGLLDSYNEGENWQFAYCSEEVVDLPVRERIALKGIFEKVGYDVSFDSGAPYDEQPMRIIVSYDTRKNNRQE